MWGALWSGLQDMALGKAVSDLLKNGGGLGGEIIQNLGDLPRATDNDIVNLGDLPRATDNDIVNLGDIVNLPMQGVENLVSDGFTRGTEEYPGQIDPGFGVHPKLPGGWAKMPGYYDKSNPPWAKPSATPPVDRIVRDGLGIVEGGDPAGKEGFMGWLTSEKGQQFLSSLQGMQQPQQQQQMPQFGPIGSGQFGTAGNPLAPRQPVSWRSR
jgi:hypothetical protein